MTIMKLPWERAVLAVINHAGVVLKRDNAVVPINALAILGAIVCFGAAYLLPQLSVSLVVCGIALLGFAVAAYFILLFRDPDRLQSEKYQLAQAKMQQMIVAKELTRPLTSEELPPAVSNPALPMPELPEGDGK